MKQCEAWRTIRRQYRAAMTTKIAHAMTLTPPPDGGRYYTDGRIRTMPHWHRTWTQTRADIQYHGNYHD